VQVPNQEDSLLALNRFNGPDGQSGTVKENLGREGTSPLEKPQNQSIQAVCAVHRPECQLRREGRQMTSSDQS